MANAKIPQEIIDAIRAEMTKWTTPSGQPVTQVAIVEQGTDQAVATVTR